MRRRITGCSNNNKRKNNRTNNIRTNNGCSHKRKNLKRITRKRRGGTAALPDGIPAGRRTRAPRGGLG